MSRLIGDDIDIEQIHSCSHEPFHLAGSCQSCGLIFVLKHTPKDESIAIALVSQNIENYGWDASSLIGHDIFNIFSQVDSEVLLKSLLELTEDDVASELSAGAAFQTLIHNSSENSDRTTINHVQALYETRHPKKRFLNVSINIGPGGIGELAHWPDTSPSHSYKNKRQFPMSAMLVASNIPNHWIFELEHCEAQWDSPEYIQTITGVANNLQSLAELDELCNTVAQAVYDLTEMDHVMVYKFDHLYNGQVIAEVKKPEIETFLNHHFPHTEVPPLARALYVRNTMRYAYDVSANNIQLHPPTIQDDQGQKHKLDMSDCKLRSVQSGHLVYLRNMGVQSSLSISIVVKGRLWGQFVCHNHSGPYYPNVYIRRTCEMLGILTSLQLESMIREKEVQVMLDASRLFSNLARISSPNEFFDSFSETFLGLVDCNTVVLQKRNGDGQAEMMIYGDWFPEKSVQHIVETMQSMQGDDIVHTDNLEKLVLRKDLLKNEVPGQEAYTVAGICIISCPLYTVSLLRREYAEALICRPGPEIVQGKDGYVDLVSRSSFAAFIKERRGYSKFWDEQTLRVVRKFHENLLLAAHRIILEEEQMRSLKLEESKNLAMKIAEQKSTFLAHMSHELRTPFNGMIGMLSQLLDTPLESTQQEYTTTAYECAANMLEILDDVLLISKLESNKMQLRKSAFIVSQLLAGTYELMNVRAKQINVNFLLKGDEAKHSAVIGDPGRLRQILLNLIGNALKFTDAGGLVELSVCSYDSIEAVIERTTSMANDWESCSETNEGLQTSLLACAYKSPVSEESGVISKWYMFQIRDTGIGMEKKDLEKLFQAFTQLDSSTSRKYEGTGLGLAICKQLVDLMSGKIFALSSHRKGSMFCFVIPLANGRVNQEGLDNIRHVDTSTLAALEVQPNQGLTMESNVCFDFKSWSQEDVGLANRSCRQGKRASKQPDQQKIPAPICENDKLVALESIKEPAPKRQKTMDGGKKDLVLVAEDNKINQRVVKAMITRMEKYDIVLACNGLEAVSLALQHHHRLLCILMDYHMPEMDGLEASEKIREIECERDLKRVPIVALTADVWDSTREKCKQAGMDFFITKPVIKNALQNLLDELSGNETPSSASSNSSLANSSEKEEISLAKHIIWDTERLVSKQQQNTKRLEQLMERIKSRESEQAVDLLSDIQAKLATLSQRFNWDGLDKNQRK